ncbi:MAG: class II fructose-bisphosphate aldolase [Eubacteriales bacterium]|nr:class II fructose-bisphosphate aldolase [Eubacteriales bacterium]
MLVNLEQILKIAEARKIAIGSFNTPNLESIQAVIGAAEELDVPVIIMHAEVHENLSPLHVIGKVMIQCAKDAKVPVCVHLDHGESLSYLNKALELGFTSVMYDGSALPYEENVANTSIAVALAHKVGASVEAEIGTLGKRELGYQPSASTKDDPKQVYTNPADAERFVKETGIDALACSFGTAHGLYLTKPKLDMRVLDEVKRRIDIPIVMHGGSGVSEEDYKTVIQKGVRKINYYTYMAKAGGQKIEKKFHMNSEVVRKGDQEYIMYYALVAKDKQQPIYYHDIVRWGMEAMKENVLEALKVFSGLK